TEGARAGERGGCARAERLLKLVIGPGDQYARLWVAGDGRFVLLVLRERQVMVLIYQEVACNGRSCRGGADPVGDHRAAHDSDGERQNIYCGQELSPGVGLDHLLG